MTSFSYDVQFEKDDVVPDIGVANATAERLVGIVRRECLDHLMPLSERHLGAILTEGRTFAALHREDRWGCRCQRTPTGRRRSMRRPWDRGGRPARRSRHVLAIGLENYLKPSRSRKESVRDSEDEGSNPAPLV